VLQRYGFAQTALLAGLRERPLGWLNGWTPDLLLLTVLLAATAAGGRAFAKLAVGGHPVYPTELLLLAVLALAVARCGAAGAVARLRTLLPLWAVGTLWVAGAIATLRGLSWGLGNVAHDVGLVEYSVLLAVAALVADTPERARRTVNALLVAGIVAVPAYQIAWDTSPTASFGHWENPGVAVAIYLSVSILVVGARLFFAVPPPLPRSALGARGVQRRNRGRDRDAAPPAARRRRHPRRSPRRLRFRPVDVAGVPGAGAEPAAAPCAAGGRALLGRRRRAHRSARGRDRHR
jgi:hypothetical protein